MNNNIKFFGESITTLPKLSPEQIKQAKEWIKDCQWGEEFEDGDIDALSDSEVESGVNRHYDGGLKQFIKDCEPTKVIKEIMINTNEDLNVSVSEVQKIIDEMVKKRNPDYKKCDEKVAEAYNDSINRRNKKNGQETGWFKKLL